MTSKSGLLALRGGILLRAVRAQPSRFTIVPAANPIVISFVEICNGVNDVSAA
jgi:hypothetical protein